VSVFVLLRDPGGNWWRYGAGESVASFRNRTAVPSWMVMVVQCRWQAALADPGVVQFAQLSGRFGDSVEVVYHGPGRQGRAQTGGDAADGEGEGLANTKSSGAFMRAIGWSAPRRSKMPRMTRRVISGV